MSLETSKIAHVCARHQTPLHLEANLRALRQAVWLSVYLAHPWPGLVPNLTRILTEIDRQLEEMNL